MPDTGIRIRAAESDDLAFLIELIWDDPLGRAREDISEASRPAYAAAFSAVLDDPNSTILVAEDRGLVVGCIQLTVKAGLSYRGAWRMVVEDLRVARNRRGDGIGTLLMRATESWAVERGCQIIELFVHSDRVDAHRFYDRLGFAGAHRGFRKTLPGRQTE